MNTEQRTIVSAIVVGGAVLLSLLVAFVLFKVMESSAEVTLNEWKFGGAFAGFVASFFIIVNGVTSLFNLFLADETRRLQEEVRNLQIKLFKGSPCPEGFVREIDERDKIVFARPVDWRLPTARILYQYAPKNSVMNFNINYQDQDAVAECYRCYGNRTFDINHVNVDELYDIFGESMRDKGVWERLYGKGNFRNQHVDFEAYAFEGIRARRCNHYYEFAVNRGDGTENVIKIRQLSVFVWLPERRIVMQITFTDRDQNFLKSSEIFDKILESVRLW